jgi:hypothetical protein
MYKFQIHVRKWEEWVTFILLMKQSVTKNHTEWAKW